MTSSSSSSIPGSCFGSSARAIDRVFASLKQGIWIISFMGRADGPGLSRPVRFVVGFLGLGLLARLCSGALAGRRPRAVAELLPPPDLLALALEQRLELRSDLSRRALVAALVEDHEI